MCRGAILHIYALLFLSIVTNTCPGREGLGYNVKSMLVNIRSRIAEISTHYFMNTSLGAVRKLCHKMFKIDSSVFSKFSFSKTTFRAKCRNYFFVTQPTNRPHSDIIFLCIHSSFPRFVLFIAWISHLYSILYHNIVYYGTGLHNMSSDRSI